MSWKTTTNNINIGRGSSRGVKLALEHILTVANNRVPIEEHTLQNSGETALEGTKGVVSYESPYAVRQHEDMTLNHDAGRSAKWLEQTFNSEAKAAAEIIAREIRGEL